MVSKLGLVRNRMREGILRGRSFGGKNKEVKGIPVQREQGWEQRACVRACVC